MPGEMAEATYMLALSDSLGSHSLVRQVVYHLSKAA